jgi:hypothetical protein
MASALTNFGIPETELAKLGTDRDRYLGELNQAQSLLFAANDKVYKARKQIENFATFQSLVDSAMNAFSESFGHAKEAKSLVKIHRCNTYENEEYFMDMIVNSFRSLDSTVRKALAAHPNDIQYASLMGRASARFNSVIVSSTTRS